MAYANDDHPGGVFSLLDTDLYKLTMQSAVLKYFPDVEVTFDLTNRTPQMRLNREAFAWLKSQIARLVNIVVSSEEIDYLRKNCTYFSEAYLHFLSSFRLDPSSHVHCTFHPLKDTGSPLDTGDIALHTAGRWIDTILYEIPLLALTSEAYFKFMDRDWSHSGQRSSAKDKGLKVLQAGCLVSEFGSRRRRDYHTHELVLQGLLDAQAEGSQKGYPGKITGTSNVHFAMRFGIPPIGTVAHEWFMGVAAVTDDYSGATETALRYWIATFGKGVLGIALTDTFGTSHFLEAFRKVVPSFAAPDAGAATTSASAAASGASGKLLSDSLSTTAAPIEASGAKTEKAAVATERYADVFTGTRQDSGDPLDFIRTMRDFYDREGITSKKTIVFSDSLNIDRCIEYQEAAQNAGFQPSFGVGTFFTNDFANLSTGEKSVPLNIVIKLSSANGKPAIKISDNTGKNTGDPNTVRMVKDQLGYTEHRWVGGDERTRWGETAKK